MSTCSVVNREVHVCCPLEAVNTNGTEVRETFKDLLPIPGDGVCGTGFIEKIYGGNLTKIDEFPWMALLKYSKRKNQGSPI